MAKLAQKKIKRKVTSITIREQAKKDLSPTWDDHEELSAAEFTKRVRDAMQYYNLNFNAKDLKPAVVKWMQTAGYTPPIVEQFKKTQDWRCIPTMGSLCSCLLRGMPDNRSDFNGGRSVVDWIKDKINDVLLHDAAETDEEIVKPVTTTVSIQDRVRETAIRMTESIDDALEEFITDPEKFDPKNFKILNSLKAQQVKPAHARIIKDFYNHELCELEEVLISKDEDLKEAYKVYTKKQIRNLIAFHKEIQDACTMLMQEAKANRKPRTKKPVAKDKIVDKLKFRKSDDSLKLVSINPTDIIGAKELWVYNTKNRKLGRYVADDLVGPLNVRGTTIIGYSEHASIQKTVRKPEEKLKEFKASGKVALRTFLDNINATDTKLNGRINDEIILLKVN